jgi:mannose-1-phosphate guanylyltransferase
LYAVIMAGGSGTRFWPRSRESKSKQFLNIIGKKTLIEQTLDRFTPLVGRENLYIVAKSGQKAQFRQFTGRIPRSHFIYEPMGKDTAPCIGLAAVILQRSDPDAVMAVTPADHLILDLPRFRKSILAAGQLAREEDTFVTLGIVPDRPATGYGYIQIDGGQGSFYGVEAFRVKTFAEKPNVETARSFLESGDFLWNSGIFVFRASVYLKAVEEHLPDLYDGLCEIREALDKPEYPRAVQRVYKQIRSISIDFGIMEKTSNVLCVRGDFRWSDLGSWEQVHKLSEKDGQGNVVSGDAVLVDTTQSYVRSDGGVVAVLGLDRVVVVQEDNVTLVCRMDRTEDVKQVVERLKRKKLDSYT